MTRRGDSFSCADKGRGGDRVGGCRLGGCTGRAVGRYLAEGAYRSQLFRGDARRRLEFFLQLGEYGHARDGIYTDVGSRMSSILEKLAKNFGARLRT